MNKEETIEAQVEGYISNLLCTHFGKGPASVIAEVHKPFVTIHLHEFLASTEKVLMDQNELSRIQEIRDLLMHELKDEIKLDLLKTTDLDIKEVYADWNVENRTGLLILVLTEEANEQISEWPEGVDKNAFYQEVAKISKMAKKEPETTAVFWMAEETVLIRRTGVLVEIERAMIASNFTGALKLAKRPLESKFIAQSLLKQILTRNIVEVFSDWNFQKDIGYMVLILEPKR